MVDEIKQNSIQEIKQINIRDFTEDEIKEISGYVLNSTPYTERLIQTLYPLTESPVSKAQTFCASYRIIQTVINFLENDNVETKKKLIQMLEYTKDVYTEVFDVLLRKSNVTNYGQSALDLKINSIMRDFDKNSKINYFINIFLVFSEKHELLSTDKVVGLELETPEGKEVYKAINTELSGLDSNNIVEN